jgi:hypothetical protein
MMANGGGIYRLDLLRNEVRYISLSELRLQEPVLGIAIQNDKLLLFTKTHLSVCDKADSIVATIPYPFKGIKPYDNVSNVYSPSVRENGDLIIRDADGLKIWNIANKSFKLVPLDSLAGPGKLIAAFDQAGNYFFKCNGGIYILRQNNELVKWSPKSPEDKSIPTSICIDRSGVLWVGSNGYGLRQYDLLQTGMHGYRNQNSFVIDVLSHYQVPVTQLAHTFLSTSIPFANRSAGYKDTVWIADIHKAWIDPKLALFVNHSLVDRTFHDEGGQGKKDSHRIVFLAYSNTGTLWGVDHRFQLLQFNTRRLTYRVTSGIDLDLNEEINGMVPDGDSCFYISTTRNLARLNVFTGRTETLTSFLPDKDLLTVSNDPDDKNILWIGTLSDGLIRFDKSTKATQVFSISTGLPNNTIYSILSGNDHLLWCSSNKGIFAFNKKNLTIRSFTSGDGLIDDEFNRYHYMAIPNGDLAFGGPLGYTLFNPSKLRTDDFNPQIALTGLSVINTAVSEQALDTLTTLRLGYDQNSIIAEFAAMQFDFPEKAQYRYMLTGFDKNWMITGNENKASYTNLPPGSYELLLNASNTNWKWSSYTRRIRIIIAPPFWKTWWFYTAVILAISLLVYWFLIARIRSIKKAHDQQLRFERKAMELHALALRARMNPHFIFNCLNSIKALIQEKQDKKAIHYLTTFVTLIRKQLNNSSDEITLEDELGTCRLYLQLEAMRFDDRISFQIDVDDEELLGQIRIPPLILQPVIENAIVHGLLPVEQGGLVSIKIRREEGYVVCTIEDNGIGRDAAAAHKKKSSRLHESRGVQLLEDRVSVYNRLHRSSGSFRTTDLFHPDGSPSGTRVTIKFNAEL